MTTDTLTLGTLVLIGTQQGPYVDVTVDGHAGRLHLTIPEWTSLRAVADVLAAADRRHAEDRKEIERLRICNDGLRICNKNNGNGFDRAVEQLTSLTAERDVLRQECRELTEQRDAAAREAERWRHGAPIEGDFVCPDSLERDEARAEVERLTACLAKANANHESFERPWYLAQDEADRLRSDLAAAHAAVDAMAERLQELDRENERLKTVSRNIHQIAWEGGVSHERARLQPIVSVLGDWDWRGIVEDGCWRAEYEGAIEKLVHAMATVEGEIEKAKENP